MPTVKESCIAIAEAVNAAEDAAPSEELTALHELLWDSVNEHASTLGLSEQDLADIGAVGPQQRGGQPKQPK